MAEMVSGQPNEAAIDKLLEEQRERMKQYLKAKKELHQGLGELKKLGAFKQLGDEAVRAAKAIQQVDKAAGASGAAGTLKKVGDEVGKVTKQVQQLHQAGKKSGGLEGFFKDANKALARVDRVREKYEKFEKKAKDLEKFGDKFTDAGETVFAQLQDPMDRAKEYERLVSKLKQQGLADYAVEDAKKFVGSMDSIGISLSDKMKLFVEAQKSLRLDGMSQRDALAGAKVLTPLMAAAQEAAGGFSEDKQASFQQQSADYMHWVAASGGAKDGKRAQVLADAGFKLLQTTDGRVNWEQLGKLTAPGAAATSNLSVAGLTALAPLLQGKGGGAGLRKGLEAAYGHLAGAGHTSAAAREMQRLGLADRAGGLSHKDELQSDPAAFYEKYVRARFDALKLTARQREQENIRLFGQQGAAAFNSIDRNQGAINKARRVGEQVQGVQGAMAVHDAEFDGKLKRTKAAWASLKTTIGNMLLPIVEKFLDKLTDLFNWLNKHTAVLQVLVGIFITLGTALMGIGAYIKVLVFLRKLATVLELFKGAGKAGKTLGKVFELLKGGAAKLEKAAKPLVNLLKGKLKSAFEWLKGPVKTISELLGGKLRRAMSTISSALRTVLPMLGEGLGKAFSLVSSGLRALMPALGPLLAVAGAGAAGYAVGSKISGWIDKKLSSPGHQTTFGGAIFDWINPNATPGLDPKNMVTARARRPAQTVIVNTHVDGKVVAKTVLKNLHRQGQAPNAGMSMPDASVLAPQQVGAY